MELSSTLWAKLPAGAQQVVPPAAGALGVLGVIAIARGNANRNPELHKTLIATPRVDDVAFLQSKLLKTLEENKALTRRCLEAELALKAANDAVAKATGAKKAK